jgi:hypothetical protein
VKNRLWFSPLIGYSLGYRSSPARGFEDFPNSFGTGSFTNDSRTIYYSFASSLSKNRFYSLLETGIGIHYRVFKDFRMSLTASYFNGFSTQNRVNGTIRVDRESGDFFATSTDENFNVRLGVSYPIAGFKKKE